MWQENLGLALNEFWHFLWILFLIVLGASILSGIMREFLDQNKLHRRLGLSKESGVWVGAALGILTPFCSASSAPVIMNMVQFGASFSSIFAFVITADLINFVVMGIIIGAYGWKVALFWFIWIFGCAILSGYLIGKTPIQEEVKVVDPGILQRLSPEEDFDTIEEYLDYVIIVNTDYIENSDLKTNESDTTENQEEIIQRNEVVSKKIRITKSIIYAMSIFLNVFPYVLVGAAISAFASVFVPTYYIEKYIGNQSASAIPIASVIGIPLYMRIEMSIPLLKVLLEKGMGSGAAMALLIGGTGASFAEISILNISFKPKAILAYVVCMILIAIIGGYVFQFTGLTLI